MQLAILAAIAAAIVGVAFALQNNVPVTVNFLLWRFDSSLAMVLLLALAGGAIIVALLTTPITLKWQWQLARQKRRIEELEKTGEEQRHQMAELASRLPVGTPTAAQPRPYVGLKQIFAGRGADASEELGSPPV